jgi:hypothetical protein
MRRGASAPEEPGIVAWGKRDFEHSPRFRANHRSLRPRGGAGDNKSSLARPISATLPGRCEIGFPDPGLHSQAHCPPANFNCPSRSQSSAPPWLAPPFHIFNRRGTWDVRYFFQISQWKQRFEEFCLAPDPFGGTSFSLSRQCRRDTVSW